MLSWFDTRESKRFARDLALQLLGTLETSTAKGEAKFMAKTEKALVRADREVGDFRQRERMNFYKRSALANTFLWTLKDGGCPTEYATQLTEWLTVRL
ncbi:hypothetical protein [Ramlibacter sp. Leaf400]|uniref:hypothetical protein n=1 Tax=Ramlibacter sp. Leaf400 TaxID=1736365 RepID=UPI00070217D6|nr:hypothetical protein [Ramlibacter sp. Leaf400]KQT12360.1 hypothetical protein ASG30_03445 [Ramlibacter sp. Leaf400]